MNSPLRPAYLARVLPCVVWIPACQGAGTPCLKCGRVCGGRGGGGAVAPAPVPGSHPQTHPHTPIVTHLYATGTGCESIERVFFARGGAGGGATAYAWLSSLWGMLGWWEHRDSFARSANISVAVQNK